MQRVWIQKTNKMLKIKYGWIRKDEIVIQCSYTVPLNWYHLEVKTSNYLDWIYVYKELNQRCNYSFISDQLQNSFTSFYWLTNSCHFEYKIIVIGRLSKISRSNCVKFFAIRSRYPYCMLFFGHLTSLDQSPKS